MKKFVFYFTSFPLFIFSFSNICSNIEPAQKSFFVYGDFLYWKTQEDGLDFIYDDRINNGNNNGLSGDIKRATYAWQPGFKIGFKYQFNFYNEWVLDGQYGYITPNNTQEIFNPENKQMSSTFQMPTNFTMHKAHSRTKITNHFADLLLERYFKNISKIKLGFLSGLSAIWIKRDWVLKFYDYGNNIRVIKPSWHFKGVGLKTGLDFDWILKNGFFWSGKSCIAGIFGNFDSWMKTYDLPSNTLYENSHLDDFRIVTNVQFLLGPSWQKDFNNFNLKLYANYETNIWFNLAQVNRSSYQTTASNPQSRFTKNTLQMYGLTLFASINF
jgi:hypothetical protein